MEEGKHAAESGMDLKAYAAASGKDRSNMRFKACAWKALVEKMTTEAWTVATTREFESHFRIEPAAAGGWPGDRVPAVSIASTGAAR